jgi:hypothetical protein
MDAGNGACFRKTLGYLARRALLDAFLASGREQVLVIAFAIFSLALSLARYLVWCGGL